MFETYVDIITTVSPLISGYMQIEENLDEKDRKDKVLDVIGILAVLRILRLIKLFRKYTILST